MKPGFGWQVQSSLKRIPIIGGLSDYSYRFPELKNKATKLKL